MTTTTTTTSEASSVRNPDLVTLLLTLGYGVDDQIVLASNSTGIFAPIVCKGMRDAVRQAALHSAADVWITVNPMRPITAGRGTADDVERLAALWVDLDFKIDGAGDEATAREIIRELSMILGTPPAAVVESGGGLHPYWPITDGLDIDAARVLLARWRDLVERVAADNGANVDAVFDLPRVLRCPGTSNHKSGTARAVVTVFADDDEWQALTIDDVADRLSDAGIVTPTLDSIADVVAVDSWPVGDGVCAYVAKMIAGWADDRPTARHPWVASAAVRVACACRAGCIGTLEARRALETLTGRLVDLTSGDPDQGTRRDYTQATREIESLWKWAIGQVETMTDAQVAKELGGHSHEPLPTLDDLVIPAQTDSAQDDTGSDGEAGAAATWYADLSWVLTGEAPQPPQPRFLERTDGQRIFYPGSVNALYGEPETGKSWIALAAASQCLLEGGIVAFLDADHNGATTIATRILSFGVPPDVVADPARFRYVEPHDDVELIAAIKGLGQWAAGSDADSLVVMDSIGELLPMLGSSSESNDEVTGAMRHLTSDLIRANAGIIVLDHVPKNSTSEGFAIGAQAKKRAIRGAQIKVTVMTPLAPESCGKVALEVTKDTHGQVRAASTESKFVGVFVLDSTGDVITWRIDPGKGGDDLVPYLERVSRWLADNPGEHSMRAIREGVTGKGSKVDQAVRALVAKGYAGSKSDVRNREQTARIVFVRAYDHSLAKMETPR